MADTTIGKKRFRCPKDGSPTEVKDVFPQGDTILRVRRCLTCGGRFSTLESFKAWRLDRVIMRKICSGDCDCHTKAIARLLDGIQCDRCGCIHDVKRERGER